jgi:hypothetical protein
MYAGFVVRFVPKMWLWGATDMTAWRLCDSEIRCLERGAAATATATQAAPEDHFADSYGLGLWRPAAARKQQQPAMTAATLIRK